MFVHAAAATKHEGNNMYAIYVEDGEGSSAPLWIRARVLVDVSKLDNVSNFSKATVLEKFTRPLLSCMSR